jgi:hypothetical protein
MLNEEQLIESVLSETESNDTGTTGERTSGDMPPSEVIEALTPKTDEPQTTAQVPETKVETAPTPPVETKAPEAVKTPEQVAAEAAPKKSVTLKVGPRGKELDLDLETAIPVTVDGEEKLVPLSQLRNEYSGKVAYDKRFSELDQTWKKYETDKSATEEQLNTILEKAHGDDVLGAIIEITKLADRDVGAVIRNIQEKVFGDVQKIMNMSPTERELHFTKIERDALKLSKQSEERHLTAKQAHEDLSSQADTLRETYKLADKDIETAQSELQGLDKEKIKSIFGSEKPTPVQMAQLAAEIKFADRATKALTDINPELAKDMNILSAAGHALAAQPDISSVKEMSELLIKKFSFARVASPSENLSKKVEQAQKVLGSAPTTVRDTEDLAKAGKSKDTKHGEWDLNFFD